jgi:predicted adenylyl cyclase CyaB
MGAESMGRNIEIKAKLTEDQFERVRKSAGVLADRDPEVLLQTDTFFQCTSGRLKLRVFGDGSGELIQYERADCEGPKASSYVRSPTAEPATLLEALGGALGVRGVVRKRREVFLAEKTRIHLDAVEQLGMYLELEVVLDGGDTDEMGQQTAAELLQRLGVENTNLVSGAYIDLLEQRQNVDTSPV